MTTNASARCALALFAGSVATLGGASADTLLLRPDRLPGGDTTTVTLALDQAPPVDTDYPISLSGTNAGQSEPAIRMRAGQTRADFKVTTAPAPNQQVVEIVVLDPRTRGTLAKASLAVTPAVLKALTLNRSAVVGGTPNSTVTGTVTLDGQAAGAGLTVSLGQACASCQAASQNLLQLGLPPSVLVPGGSRSATFNIESTRLPARKQYTVLASQGSVVKTSALEVSTLHPQSIAVSPATISGAQQSTVTITLNAPAFSNFQVHLSCSQLLDSDASRACSSTQAHDPKALLLAVPVGQTSVSCRLSNTKLTSPTQVLLRAEGKGVNGDVETTLTVAP